MAIRNNLPTYGTPGWGATLNNYLRSLEARTSSLEERVNTSSKEGISSSSISSYRGSGVITHDLAVYDINDEANKDEYTKKLTTTTLLTSDDDDNYSLTFQNLNCYIAPTLNQSAIIYKEPVNNPGLTINFNSLGIEGTAMIVFHYAADEATLSIEPCYVGTDTTVAQDVANISTNFCRLGYLTKIGEDVYYTPAPSIANIAFEDKVFLTNKPCYRLYRSDELGNEYRIGEYDFMSEGLNFHKADTSAGATSVVYESLYNIHNFKDNKVKYFEITSSTDEGGSTTETITALADLTAPDPTFIFVYYVTLAGIVFVYKYTRDENDSISTNNGLACLPIEMPTLLKQNFKWLQPMEAMRVATSRYGNEMLSHMNSYNGISPQIPATPIFGTDKYLAWSNFKLGVDVNSSHKTLQIQPVLTNESTTVVLNVAGGTNSGADTTTKPGIFTYNSSIPYDLYFGGTDDDQAVFGIIHGETDDREYMDGDNYHLYINPDYYSLGTLSFRDKSADIVSSMSYNKIEITKTGGYTSQITSDCILTKYIVGSGSDNLIELNSEEGHVDFFINGRDQLTNSMHVFYGFNSAQNPEFCVEFFKNEDDEGSVTNQGCFYLRGNHTDNTVTGGIKTTDNFTIESQKDLNLKSGSSNSVRVLSTLEVVNKTCKAQSFEVTSDIRHKNIYGVFTDSATDIINLLPIYNFTFKSDPEKPTIGITAQDLDKVMPILVDKTNDQQWHINESKLVYICMKAIKELQEEIEALKTKLSEV